MIEPLIRVRDLCKVYNPGENEVRALDHVDLSIDKGELVGIIGHSGSGKSTLMNMLGCLDVPTSGNYYLNGKDVSNMTDDELSDELLELPPPHAAMDSAIVPASKSAIAFLNFICFSSL